MGEAMCGIRGTADEYGKEAVGLKHWEESKCTFASCRKYRIFYNERGRAFQKEIEAGRLQKA